MNEELCISCGAYWDCDCTDAQKALNHAKLTGRSRMSALIDQLAASDSPVSFDVPIEMDAQFRSGVQIGAALREQPAPRHRKG